MQWTKLRSLAIGKAEPKYYCFPVADNCLCRKFCYLESFYSVAYCTLWISALECYLHYMLNFRIEEYCFWVVCSGHWQEGQYFLKYSTVLISVALFTNLFFTVHTFFSSLQTHEPLFIEELFYAIKVVTIQYYCHFKYLNHNFPTGKYSLNTLLLLW